MKNSKPTSATTAAASSPSLQQPFTQVPSRPAPASTAYITSIGLHPVEPFQVVGLSSGEVCLYTASTDALSWLLEMDSARQAQLRLDAATAVPASVAQRASGASADAKAKSAMTVSMAPPDYPLKVLSFASLSSSSAAAGGCSIVHCGFLRGREEDLLKEVVQLRQPGLAASSSSVARHLLYVVTSANDIFVADIKSEVVLVRWCASTAANKGMQSGAAKSGGRSNGGGGTSAISTTSPLHTQFLITQVETYGALLFLTVARRSAVRAAVIVGSADGPERNALDQCNEPLVYVLHWGYTDPFAASTTKSLTSGGGALVVKAASQDKGKLRDPAISAAAVGGPQRSSGGSSSSKNNVTSLSIRAHPFAPLLMLILNRAEVQVFAVDGDVGELTSKKCQFVIFNALQSSTSSKRAVVAPPTSALPPPLLDVQFVPSAAVLVRTAHHTSSSSSSASSSSSSSARQRQWSCRNVQLLLLSSSRLRLVCTRGASHDESAPTVPVDRVFYTAPETGAAPNSTASRSSVRFQRAWTWLGSPDTFFVLQSDRTVLELSCNDLLAASTEVPSVRSRRLLASRTVRSLASPDTCDWWCVPPTASGSLPCVQCPDALPLWGRGAVLSGVFAPRQPAAHGDSPQTLVFSRLTGLARPLPIAENEADAEAPAAAAAENCSVFHLSLLADTETVSSRCIAIRLCLTPQQQQAQPATTAAAEKGAGNNSTSSPTASPISAQRALEESVNVGIARVLCETASPALCRLEHGFYFVGSREESAYADYPFLVAGLLYVDGVEQEENDAPSAAAALAPRDGRLCASMVCLPADRRELQRLYDTARVGCGSGSGDGCSAFTPNVAPSANLKRALQQAVQHAQVQPLPIPQFDFETPQSGRMTKHLLSCAFQLSNDGIVPCVWGLWAPVFPHADASTASASTAATVGAPLPAPQSLQLTMQTFYVSAESQQLRWRPPELVQMDDLLATNPTQVFALSSILTKGGSGGAFASAAALPPPYASVNDVLQDVDAAVVARLFLYYADRKVLVLATVETGSSREAGFDSEVIDDAYNFASRARNGRVMGGRLFTDGSGGGGGAAGRSAAGAEGRQYLRLVPHAAAEMNEWKAAHTAESLSSALLSAVQLSAVTVNDHGEPALQVAVTSRRFGVALAMFPLAGRRGSARVSASLQPVKVYVYRRWEELLCVTAAVTQQAEESGRSRQDASGDRGRGGSMNARGGSIVEARATATTVLGIDDVRHSPLLRRYRTWVDTVAFANTAYASVPLAQWVWPPSWLGKDEGKGANEEVEGEQGEAPKHTSTAAAAAANPILLLQRGRALYVLHQTGAAVQVCSSLLHCSPLQVVPQASSSSDAVNGLCLQLGSYPGLLARNRLLRQLQLQYGPYQFYADATITSQAPVAKVKWFKKFWKRANSSEAARRRAVERPHQLMWLQRVYAPSADNLAYQFASRASNANKNNSSGGGKNSNAEPALPPQITAALERLVGTGVAHIGNVLDVDMTDPLRLATLAVEALAASHGMQQLVSSAGMLTDSLRNTLRHLTTVLEEASTAASTAAATGSEKDRTSKAVDDDVNGGSSGTPMSVMRGNWAVAEALARLPLSCVMTVMGQEVRRAAAAAAAAVGPGANVGTAGVSDVRRRRRLADLQRWWWLLMRCSALVTAVNAVQLVDASRVMSAVLEELPVSSPLLQPPADEAAVTSAVSQSLLLCSPRFLPHVVTQMLQSGTTSAAQQAARLEAAVRAALRELGAEETAAPPPPPQPEAEHEESGEEKEAAETKPSAKAESKPASAPAWSSLFSTVRMDGAHWTHAVYYTNLMTHLRHLAKGDGAETTPQHQQGEEGAEPTSVNGSISSSQVRAVAAQCVAGADVAVEHSAAAVLEVAMQTIGVFLGAVVDVPAASRSRMADAVAQSMSKRQQLLKTSDKILPTPRRTTATTAVSSGSGSGSAGAAAETDTPFAEEDVYFLNQTPIDRLRHSLYAAQWRDLYGTFGYATRHFFRSAASGGEQQASSGNNKAAKAAPSASGSLPYQLAYDAYVHDARARESAANPALTTDAGPSATNRHHRGRVQKVLLTEQAEATNAVVPPPMEIVPIPDTPLLAGAQTTNTSGGNGKPAAAAAAPATNPPPQSPLSLRAAVARQEADLHNTYFNGFAAPKASEEEPEHSRAAAADGNDVGNDSLVRNFRAELNATEAPVDASASAVKRERQQAAERQRVPNASSFAPSVTRRTAAAGATGEDGPNAGAGAAAADVAGGGEKSTASDNVYGDNLYGAVPSQQAFFERFEAKDD